MRLAAILMAPLLLFSAPAFAGLGANAGAIQVIGEPHGDDLGLYPYVAVSKLYPVGKVALIPAVGVEWAPRTGNWGFTGVVTADYALGARVGLDLNAAFIHDQHDHHWSDAAFLAGGGPGFSIYAGKWTVSPYVSWFQGLNVSGGALVPGINVSFAP